MVPTIIRGMGALFGFPEQSDVPPIATMVSSRWWPLISSYGASGLSDKVDDGIMKEALLDFYISSGKRKLDQIIIFRDKGSPDNVLHGTFIDSKVCHPKNNDFLPWYPCWNDWNHEEDPLSCSLRPGWVFG
ncbi:Protein argonaute 4 -like protein [Gossypium arboreum]|uniref:Protein argonaute 4-like protein n=1 Tax=Gossypium arboreum TaxID=29729 RepID=A0A0B0PSM0_GOSAR|nr:Protein argonaute 4 -like protein [Gossypium arboreum]